VLKEGLEKGGITNMLLLFKDTTFFEEFLFECLSRETIESRMTDAGLLYKNLWAEHPPKAMAGEERSHPPNRSGASKVPRT